VTVGAVRGRRSGAIPWLFVLAGAVALLPVARLAWEVVRPLMVFDAAAVVRVLAAPATWRATLNSVSLAAGATGVSLVLGGAFALAVALTDVRGKTALSFALILPLMIPPQIVALAWIHLTGTGSPVLRPLGLAPPPGTPNPVYSSAGMILVMGIEHAPLVFLSLRAALRLVPRDLVEAAQSVGAGRWRVLRTVVLPLSLPGLASGAALAFVAALGNFGVPALLGIPAGIPVLPTLIYRRLSGFGPSVLPEVAVLAVLIGAIACLGIWVQTAFQARLDSRLLGGSAPTAELSLRRGRPVVEVLCWGVLALILVAPLAALAGTSLVRAYGLPLTPATATLAHYREVLALDQAGRAFANSFLLSAGAAALLVITAVPLAHAMTRREDARNGWARTLGILVELPHAVPGVVLAIGCILVFLKPLPVLGISLYGTLWVIFAAYLARFLSMALRPAQAACAALDPAMEEAARACGAGPLRRLLTIVAPLVAPAAMAGGVLAFLTAFNELTVSVMLWSQGRETLGVVVYALEEGGSPTLAAALSVIAVVVVVLALLLAGRLGRRLPPGVVPWRG
jgi:iron(III) transport system permease protein